MIIAQSLRGEKWDYTVTMFLYDMGSDIISLKVGGDKLNMYTVNATTKIT